MKAPTGATARENYEAARKLVSEGRYDEARAIDLQPSDRSLIEKRIHANRNELQRNTTKENE